MAELSVAFLMVGGCVVLWGDSVCYAGGSISIRGPGGPKEFQENNQCITFSLVGWLCMFFFFFFFFTVYEFLVVYLQRIMAVQYKIPDYVHISQDCRHPLSRIFVANPIRVWMNKPCLNLTINLYCEDTSYYIALVDVLSLNFNQSGN